MSNNIIIRNLDPQEITINEGGTVTGITNVYVNGTDVTIGTKAYVIVPTKLSELTNDEGFITNEEETDPTVPSYVKNITQADINSWNDKQNQLVSTQNIKTINGNSILGSGNLNITTEYTAGVGIDITDNTISNTITSYNDLTDTPTPIQYTSQLINDSGYITNRVDDLQNYLTTSVIESILPHSSDSGTGPLYLENSANYNLHITLNPSEIQQETLSGKNLLNIISAEPWLYGAGLPTGPSYSMILDYRESNSITFHADSANFNIILTNPIQLEPSTEYTIKFNRTTTATNNQWFIYNYNNGTYTTNYRDNNTNTLEYTFTTDSNGQIALAWGYGNVTGETTVYNIQIESGNTATSYEPYVGGMPSPNPLYPQDIHVVTGENSITVANKNLFEAKMETVTYNGITVTNNGDGSFTLNGTATANSDFRIDQSSRLASDNLKTYNGTYTLSCNELTNGMFLGLTQANTWTNVARMTNNNTPVTFTTNTNNVFMLYYVYSGTTLNNLVIRPMIEKSSTATSYVPHQETIYPIDLGTWDYLKIGDTSDRIFKNVLSDPDYMSNVEIGKWCRRDNIYPVYLAYIGDFTSVVDNGDKYSFYNNSATDVPRRDICENPYGKSIYFNNVADGNNNIIESTGLGTVRIDIDKKVGISTTEQLNQWINDNQVVVYFPLKSGYYYGKGGVGESLNEELNALSQAMAYEGGTNITQENDDLPFDIVADTLEKISN